MAVDNLGYIVGRQVRHGSVTGIAIRVDGMHFALVWPMHLAFLRFGRARDGWVAPRIRCKRDGRGSGSWYAGLTMII
jgi:hypothetical protein